METVPEKNLPRSRALRLAAEGRFGDAMRTLGSNGTAPSTDPSALEEMQRRHPQSELPSTSEDVPSPLMVDQEQVLSALRFFRRGSSPGGSKLRIQHFWKLFQAPLFLLLLNVRRS